MSKERMTFMPDLLVDHFEELGFLWGQRASALRSPTCTLHALRALEERIEAHVDGLLVGGSNALGIVEGGLVSEDRNEAFAAAYTLLRMNDAEAAMKVFHALLHAAGDGQRSGIAEALCVSSCEALKQPLEDALRTAEPLLRLAIFEVFMFHWPSKVQLAAVGQFFGDPDPVLRRAAWRIAGLRADLATALQTEAAVNDIDPGVRQLVLQVAAWSGHTWVLEFCRNAIVSPTVEKLDALHLLFVIGSEADVPALIGLAAKKELGLRRCRLLGSFAQAGAVANLITMMNASDPAVAVAAGEAFARITGLELQTVGRVTLPPPEGSTPDAFDEKFLEDVELPDANEAAEYWKTNEAKYLPGQRFSQGLRVPDAPPFTDSLDLVSIREACLRGAFNRKPGPRAVEFLRFPFPI